MNLKSLAKIAKGTRRKRRDVSLLEVSEEIGSLYKTHNSLSKLSRTVKLSPEMVRQFLRINDLEEDVKELIKCGLIKGVDIAYRISKLRGKDQIILARNAVDKNLSSDDVRAIVKYKTDNPELSIEKAADRVMQSKDKKVYVAYLGIKSGVFEMLLNKIKNKDREKIIKHIFNRVVHPEHITHFELNGRVVIIKVLKQGLQNMRSKARQLNVPLAKLANALVEEYLKGN